MIKLLIVEDHAIVRNGLKHLFALSADIEVHAEAERGQQALQLIQQQQFDLALVDINMPDLAGVELLCKIHKQAPKLPILIFTMHNEAQIARNAIKAGASGYLTKDCDPQVLLDAVRKIHGGGYHVDPLIAEKMVFDNQHEPTQLPHESLTARELEILKLFVAGSNIKKIAKELHISPKTVSTHKTRIMEKLKIDNNPELIRYAICHKIDS